MIQIPPPTNHICAKKIQKNYTAEIRKLVFTYIFETDRPQNKRKKNSIVEIKYEKKGY